MYEIEIKVEEWFIISNGKEKDNVYNDGPSYKHMTKQKFHQIGNEKGQISIFIKLFFSYMLCVHNVLKWLF